MTTAKHVDGDGHVVEPADLWTRQLPGGYRDRGFQVVWNEETRQEMVVAEGRVILPQGIVGVGMAGRPYTDLGKGVRYSELLPGGTDPRERIKDMDKDGIGVSILYPSLGLFLGAIQEPRLATEMCRVYNDWLAGYCRTNPQRLIGTAALPLQDVEGAVTELRRAVTELGFRGAFVRPNRYGQRFPSDPAFDPIWAEAQALGVPVGLHPAGTPDMWGACTQLQVHVTAIAHPLNFLYDTQLGLSMFVGTGVLERFPQLKVAALEAGGGWLAHWLDRMDHFHKVYAWATPYLKRKPSEYFRDQCYISFDPEEKSLPALVDIIGEDRIIWASDYPHLDAPYPGTIAELEEHIAPLPEGVKNKVRGQNALRLYGLN